MISSYSGEIEAIISIKENNSAISHHEIRVWICDRLMTLPLSPKHADFVKVGQKVKLTIDC